MYSQTFSTTGARSLIGQVLAKASLKLPVCCVRGNEKKRASEGQGKG